MGDGSITKSKKAGCGTIYLTISGGEETGKPIISLKGGKAGTCLHSQLTTIGYALTVARQSGASVERLAAAIDGVICPQSMAATGGPASCGDAVAKLLKSILKEGIV